MTILAFFDQFPSYNGQTVEIRGADGYVSVRDLNKALGKRFADWSRSKFARELLDELSQIYRMPIEAKGVENLRPPCCGLVDRVVEGNQGIYVHPAVALSYCMSNPRFQARINAWLLNLTQYGTATPHYQDWSAVEYLRGVEYSRDDIREMYG
jgi:hypothetical protein